MEGIMRECWRSNFSFDIRLVEVDSMRLDCGD